MSTHSARPGEPGEGPIVGHLVGDKSERIAVRAYGITRLPGADAASLLRPRRPPALVVCPQPAVRLGLEGQPLTPLPARVPANGTLVTARGDDRRSWRWVPASAIFRAGALDSSLCATCRAPLAPRAAVVACGGCGATLCADLCGAGVDCPACGGALEVA